MAVLNKTFVQSFCETQKINTKNANLTYIFCRKYSIIIAACRNFWENMKQKSKAKWNLFCHRVVKHFDAQKLYTKNKLSQKLSKPNVTQLNSTQSNCKSNFVGLDIVLTWNPPPPPQQHTFQSFLDQLKSWNLAQTLTRPIW